MPDGRWSRIVTTLSFINGMRCAPWVWDGFSRAFEDVGYDCVRATLRYHGDGPADPGPRLGTTSLLDYAADLEREIRGLSHLPIVVGHSMGGPLAQMLAARGLARAGVLLVPAAPSSAAALRPSVVRSFAGIMWRPGFWRRPMRLSFAKASYGIFNMVPKAQRRALFDRFCHESGRSAAAIALELLYHPGGWNECPHSNTPVLRIGTVRCRMTPVAAV